MLFMQRAMTNPIDLKKIPTDIEVALNQSKQKDKFLRWWDGIAVWHVFYIHSSLCGVFWRA